MPAQPTPPSQEWQLRLSPPAWWGSVLVVAISIIATFELGRSLGARRLARHRHAEELRTAAAPPEKSTERPVEKPTAAVPTRPTPTPSPIAVPADSGTTSPPPAKKEEPRRPPPPKAEKVEPPRLPDAEAPAEKPGEASLRFASDIQPIFQAKCIACHGGLSKRGGLDLRSIPAILRGGNSGPGFEPGKAEGSPIWETIKSGQMPPSNKPQLTAEEKRKIAAWIAAGAK
jgi:hypothetical protein